MFIYFIFGIYFKIKLPNIFLHLAWDPWAYVRPPGQGVRGALPPALSGSMTQLRLSTQLKLLKRCLFIVWSFTTSKKILAPTATGLLRWKFISFAALWAMAVTPRRWFNQMKPVHTTEVGHVMSTGAFNQLRQWLYACSPGNRIYYAVTQNSPFLS